MRLDKVARKLAGGRPDERLLRSLSADVGHELPRGRLEVLARFRELLARAEPSEPRSFEEGYRVALLEVVAAYEAEAGALQEEKEVEALLRRRGWKQVLTALEQGPRTQAQLAEALEMDKGQLSRLLKDMRSARLVEVFQTPESKHSSQPHQLSLRGQRLLERLVADRGSLSAEVTEALRMAARFFAHRLVAGRLGSPWMSALPSPVKPRLAEQVERMLTQEAQKLGILAEGELPAPNVEPPESIILERLFERKEGERIAVLDDLLERAPGKVLLLRASNPLRWQGSILRAISDEELLPNSRILQDADIWTGLFDIPRTPYVLVYENPALRALDRQQGGLLEELETRAQEKFCFFVPPQTVPREYEGISLEPYVSARGERRHEA